MSTNGWIRGRNTKRIMRTRTLLIEIISGESALSYLCSMGGCKIILNEDIKFKNLANILITNRIVYNEKISRFSIIYNENWFFKIQDPLDELCIKYDKDNVNLKKHFEKIKELRSVNAPTVPTSLEDELKSNIFLKCDQNDLKTKLNMKNQDDYKVFRKVRDLKDNF